jgi:hypothetical protein
MPRKKKQLTRIARSRKGRGTSATGGAVGKLIKDIGKITGRGLKRSGGSMRHRQVPTSVRKQHVIKLNKIIKSTKSGKTSRSSAIKRLKNWALAAHKTAKKYNAYGKIARVGYSMYNAKKGNTARIGYVQDVD